MSITPLSIEHVSDTAILTALGRAIESDRPDALFQDRLARSLVGVRGEHLAASITDIDSLAKAIAVRTYVFDELILKAVSEGEIDTVLNLGAGLDTRPYRLPLPSWLRWIDCDLPGILSYKYDTLSNIHPNCILEFMSLDITDARTRRTVFQQVNQSARSVMVVSEGLLIYLKPIQVTAIAIDLREQKRFLWWLTDLSSPNGLLLTEKFLGVNHLNSQVKLEFAPEEGVEFFHNFGWRKIALRYIFEEALRLNRINLSTELLSQLPFKGEHNLRNFSRLLWLMRT
ncbi:MAG: SAM-dependent methyltransferase [Nostoc sp.]|uniref:class I SAM-dependent methyltransferase n=1 Tax=Nostoc sp. TaxID=1180 RepID=UPI002FFA9CFB